jgi:RNA polymerase sigma-70 factor (ECF subfamily)
MTGPDAEPDAEKEKESDAGSSESGEHGSLDRGPSHQRSGMSYEIVERGPMVSSTNALTRGRAAQCVVIDDPDKDLVERWQAGDEAAFEELIRLHERRVYRLLYRMMGSKEDAEDLTQETFLSLHRYGHRFRAEARFSTFVYRVAANAALNRRRSLGRGRVRVEKLKHRQAAGDDLPSSPRNPEDSTLGGELSEHVRTALEMLSPSLRMPVILYDIEGLAYGEIAKVLGIAEGTVKSRIHRARQALRDHLKELLGTTAAEVI